MTLTPLHDRIIVKPSQPDEVTTGGIIIPDTAKEKPQQGEIIAIGKGRTDDNGKHIPLDVKAGDTVLYGKYSGTEVTIDGQDFLIMRESDVFAIINK
jgi:chaperonin GroES